MAKHIFFTLKSATWKNQLFASSTVLWRSRVFEATDVLRVQSDVDVIVKSRRYEDFQLVLPRSIDYDRRTMLQDIFELGDAMRELRPTHVNIELLNMFCKYHDASRRGEEQHMFLKNVPLTRTVQNPLVFVESYRDRKKRIVTIHGRFHRRKNYRREHGSDRSVLERSNISLFVHGERRRRLETRR